MPINCLKKGFILKFNNKCKTSKRFVNSFLKLY